MLRYPADWRTLFLLCAFASLSLGGWLVEPSGLVGAAWVAVTCASSFICAVIAHNTVHCPVFKRRWMNRVFQVWVSLSYGFPISEYVPGHNLSHHRFMQHREDVMRTTKVDTGWNLLNFALFFFFVAPGVTAGNYRYQAVMKDRMPAWNRQLQLEILLVWGVKAALLLLDWRKALLFYIVPHLFALWAVTSVNYLQHDGCDPEHPVNHSRNFVGRAFNWVMLNNGYHGIHHEQPGLHWSLTAQAHAERYHPTIHPALEEPSFFGYIFKAVVWPGRRVTYDGKPVVIEGEGPDADWVAAVRTIAPEELGAAGSVP